MKPYRVILPALLMLGGCAHPPNETLAALEAEEASNERVEGAVLSLFASISEDDLRGLPVFFDSETNASFAARLLFALHSDLSEWGGKSLEPMPRFQTPEEAFAHWKNNYQNEHPYAETTEISAGYDAQKSRYLAFVRSCHPSSHTTYYCYAVVFKKASDQTWGDGRITIIEYSHAG